MKRHTSKIRRLRTACTVALITAACSGLLATALQGADAKSEPPPKAEPPPKSEPPPKADKKAEKKAEKKKLSGAELYQTHCSRCHPERYATERTEAQWKTIMLHMRVRANLPADQTKAVQKYLQEDAGK